MSTKNTILINELFGPTVQGEGRDIGRPCFFIRVHNCPVQCPGCDTAYTFNGTEHGRSIPLMVEPGRPQPNDMELANLEAWIDKQLTDYPHCGMVLTGGEPLMHYNNPILHKLISKVTSRWDTEVWWALETSGYIGKQPIEARPHQHHTAFNNFIRLFETVTLSPKITPCLHGVNLSDKELCNNVKDFMAILATRPGDLVFKFVCRDEADVEVVTSFDMCYGVRNHGHPIYLMAYGNERDELLRTCERLVPLAAKTGFSISPRLHALLWGMERLR